MKLSAILFLLFGFSWLANGQVALDLPLIEGNPNQNVCPANWQIWETSPDLIAGNGPWPGGTYTMEDIEDGVVDGKSMGLFLANKSTKGEGWTTTLTGLKKGRKYSISIQWQQCTLTNYGGITYTGGDLFMSVDSTEKVFQSKGGINDSWQTATIDFTATSTTAIFKVRVNEKSTGAEGETGSAIVIDNSCQPCKEAGI